MLFNSSIFLFCFLPVTLCVYYTALHKLGRPISQAWLFLASLFFYGWWNPAYLPLLLGSLGFNYFLGDKLLENKKRILLTFGIAVNLAVLAFYKYAGFFAENARFLFGLDLHLPQFALPLGISFITFQKIAFLVDCYKGQISQNRSLFRFALFVSFFPQLIAGPIVHHRELIPQFSTQKKFNAYNLATGLCLLTLGLFKKIIIADTLETYASPLFSLAETKPLHLVTAWAAMLSYTFQIYFDFSGYSDMALGLGKMFGIRLPVNFFSPYKANSIISFWRRWHMTLSRFLRDYLYIPLGGNKEGEMRRYLNLLITMILGGLWHGAAWTFVIWGGLHGLYLVLAHLWRKITLPLPIYLGRLMTFLAVSFAWIFFKAQNLPAAFSIVSSLFHIQDLNGYVPYHPQGPLRAIFGAAAANRLLPLLLLCLTICWYLPNSLEIMRRGKPAIRGMRGFFPLHRGKAASALVWRPTWIWGSIIGTSLGLCLIKVLYEPSQVFLYFQF